MGRAAKERREVMKIVCGTDFSVHAAEAASFAAAMAARRNGTLRLVHAISPRQVAGLLPAEVDWIRGRLRRKLVAEGNRLRGLGATVMESLVVGRPHEVLTALASDGKADLIVVSSWKHCLPMRWLTGSVAERTAQNARVPTLVVRDHRRLLSWAEGKRPLNVFVGYDFSPSSDTAIRWVTSLKELGPRNITITHLSWSPPDTLRLGMGDGARLGEMSPEAQRLLEGQMRETCGALLDGEDANLHVTAGCGRPDVQLIDLAKAEGADLMIVGRNQRRRLSRFWLGSVSRGVLHHALTNVACVPVAAEAARAREIVPTCRSLTVWPGGGPRLTGARRRRRKRPVLAVGG